MTDTYPHWKKGMRVGVKWALILSALITLPSVLIPMGDPAPGHSAAAVWRHEIATVDFWLNGLGLFGVIFIVVFAVAVVIGAFRPRS